MNRQLRKWRHIYPYICLLHAWTAAFLLTGTGCDGPTPKTESVKPGINEPYLDPALDPTIWAKRFEVESREVYLAREEIVQSLNLASGEDVADIGAGTGLFVEPFAQEVGEEGTVYALDIAPAFVDYIRQRASDRGLSNVIAQRCSEDSIDLPANSIDVAFICDVYHHFEYPAASLQSILKALRPAGRLYIIDFERIPGVSREWILEHVRAGKDVVTAEILGEGFSLAREIELDQLEENYFLEFIKR